MEEGVYMTPWTVGGREDLMKATRSLLSGLSSGGATL